MSSRTEHQLVVFRLGTDFFGLDIFKVKEIIKYTQVTSLPSAPDTLKGIINLRNKIIPILDLKTRFKIESFYQEPKIIIVEIKGQVLGLIVDQVDEVTRLSSDVIEKPPALTQVMENYVKGVGKLKDRLLIILNLEKVIGDEILEDLQQIC